MVKCSINERSDIDFLLNECSETKLNLIGNECLSNKEAVSFSNSYESDLETKNIFENFFDDCLGSTSIGKDTSSQETLNFDADAVDLLKKTSLEKGKEEEKRENEQTPVKNNRPRFPKTPAKVKDHSSYYNHKKLRHVCTYCQKIFKSNGKLNSHIYSHTGERPFNCNNCGKAFSSKFKLVRHLLIHSEIRKFVCQICDRTFLRNDHLKNHYKVHDPQKKMYKCPKENCAKEYSSLMSHKKHMAYHNVEDGDLKCSICSVKYETKEEILFHLKSHSGSRLFKSQSDKKFKCQFCDRLFLTRKDVTRHLVVHTGERDFLCQFCPQRFGRKDHLVRHIKKSHANDDLSISQEKKLADSSAGSKTYKKMKRKTARPSPRTTTFAPARIGNASYEPAAGTCASEDSVDDDSPSIQTKKDVQDSEPTISTKEIEISTAEESSDKPRIVITVRGEGERVGVQPKSRSNLSKEKSFRKNKFPIDKEISLAKATSPTTQILLQNVPNILIIPNNSIILVGNPTTPVSNDKAKKEKKGSGPLRIAADTRETLPTTESLETSASRQEFDYNFNYDASVFQPSVAFPESDPPFPSFQSDLTSFNSEFEETEPLNFGLLNPNRNGPDKRIETDGTANEHLLSEASLQIRLLETGIASTTVEAPKKIGIVKPMTTNKHPGPSGVKDFFEDGGENMILNDSILNDFKEDESAILQLGTDCAILSSIFNQTNEPPGSELLRNLLTSENPVLSSPLPGFNQIFQNSNANSN